jgi:threonyl-tRNA synthetase
MTCPHHFMYYASKQRTYRELPMRIAELANLYRYEKSGELTGLFRVRTFCLADAHIVAMKDQAEQEITQALDLIDHINKTLGLEKGVDYQYRLSLGDRDDNNKKYYKDDAGWDFSENILRKVLKDNNHPHYEAQGEAAFYGPKIDVQVKNAHGKEETAFTVQYDFVMPKRFNLKYINSEGKEEEPIVVHRSSIGAFERTMAFLIERYKGNFPMWLSPVQVVIMPIADRHVEYSESISSQLKANNLRVETDFRAETLNAKIRDAQLQKVPYMIIVGDKEVEAKKLSIRSRDKGDQGSMDLNKFLQDIKMEIDNKSLN